MPELQSVFTLSEIIEPFAHNFGNILQRVMAETDEVLILGTNEVDLVSYAENVSETVNSSIKLLRQVRNSVGSLAEVIPDVVDLGSFFRKDRDWAKMVESFRTRGLRIVLDPSFSIIDYDPSMVTISKKHWLILLENLLQNSLEAYETDSQDRTARISLANRMRPSQGSEGEPHSHAVVSVTDVGCGFPSGLADSCCQPFFTTKPRSLHHGLGLSESLGIARYLGGTLVVDAHVSAGSIVRISLPLL